MTKLVNGIFGPETRCEPGEKEYPSNCERHGEHYWCETCEGYYGVPHDSIHSGPDAHPDRFYRDCACRVCQNHRLLGDSDGVAG